jgi:hypothetical protein
MALGQIFSEYFGFPCQSLFHQILHSYSYPGQVYSRPEVAYVLSGHNMDSTRTMRIKKKRIVRSSRGLWVDFYGTTRRCNPQDRTVPVYNFTMRESHVSQEVLKPISLQLFQFKILAIKEYRMQ